MTTRTLLTTAFAALLMAAPFAASAAPTHHRSVHPAPRHVTMAHTGRHMAATARTAPRDAGSSAVDALNQRSLDQARGGSAPAAPSAQ